MPNLWPPLMRLIVFLSKAWPWFAGVLNRYAINKLVNAAPHRPHPWSTVSDYTSWKALTDKTWSARSLPARYPRPDQLPPIEELIKMFERPGSQQRLSPKSTCLFPAFAQYLTDGFIRTQMPSSSNNDDENIRKRNTSNHEIDLCPLYGRLEAQTNALRLMNNTTGKKGRLKSQMIGDEEFAPFLYENGAIKAEFVVLDPPLGFDPVDDADVLPYIFAVGGDRANATPQISAMNALWLREHNRLAGDIEKANPSWDDERVFQTARNTVIVEFIKIVVEDYINHISPAAFDLIADPAACWNEGWNKPNWITTEFSLLYRWHSLIPDNMTWNGTSYPVGDLMFNNRPVIEGSLESHFVSLSAQKAGHLGAFNTAQPLVGIEWNSINQGRICQVDTYANYRKSISMDAPKRFEDISSDPNVVNFLKGLYKSVDDVEFYIGLFAEDTVLNSPLPSLLGAMVAVDAFSQALPNPLMGQQVFKPATFSDVGWSCIQATSKLEQVVHRNCPKGPTGGKITMTQEGWHHQW